MTNRFLISFFVALVLVLSFLSACDTSSPMADEVRIDTLVPSGETITDSELASAKSSIPRISDVGVLIRKLHNDVARPVGDRLKNKPRSEVLRLHNAAKLLSRELKKGEDADAKRLTHLTEQVASYQAVFLSKNESRMITLITARILELDPDFFRTSGYEIKAKYFGVGKVDCPAECAITYTIFVGAAEAAAVGGLIGCVGSGPVYLLCAGAVLAAKTLTIAGLTYNYVNCVDGCKSEGA